MTNEKLMYCKSCGKKRRFHYLGIQKGENSYTFYNCGYCGDTRALPQADKKLERISGTNLSKIFENEAKKRELDKIIGMIAFISFGIGLIGASNITGNIIGARSGNIIGVIGILIGLVCGGFWVWRKKIKKI